MSTICILGQEVLPTTSNLKYLFGATNIIKNSDKEKWMGVSFNGAGSWSFHNDSAKNVIIFGVDNSSSCNTDNPKENFLILGEGPIYGINGSFGSPQKKI